jgi:hypothetical protein
VTLALGCACGNVGKKINLIGTEGIGRDGLGKYRERDHFDRERGNWMGCTWQHFGMNERGERNKHMTHRLVVVEQANTSKQHGYCSHERTLGKAV